MYAWCPFGGKYGATAMISDLPYTKYAFDNNGANLSLKISDGYSGLDKYTSLTSNRDSAGYSANGNDVSSLMSYGSFDLNPNDSVIVNFAVLAGTNPQSLANSANKAYQKMHPNNNTSINSVIALNKIAILPNPATSEVTIYSSIETVENIQIFDLMGRKLNLDIITLDNQHLKINVTSLKTGVYFVKVGTKRGEYCNRLVINR
jgi:asparagine N-glycosylation enzyme membrane subunit Stt3